LHYELFGAIFFFFFKMSYKIEKIFKRLLLAQKLFIKEWIYIININPFHVSIEREPASWRMTKCLNFW